MKLRNYALAMMAGMGLTAANAAAAPLACPASWTVDGSAKVYYNPGQLTAAGSCYIDTATFNDVDTNAGGPDPSNDVNVYSYFGFSDWDKLFTDGTGGATGSWSIPPAVLNFAAFDYMLIFKDGADTNLVGFFLNEETSSGFWSTPFLNPPFVGLVNNKGKPIEKNVSHLSVYRRAAPQEVPEPGSLMLLIFGLLSLPGMAVLAQRARA